MTTFKRQGDDWHLIRKGVTKDGKATTFTSVVTELGHDSFYSQAVRITEDGNDLPDRPKVLFKRVK